ncbi:hypothetical protein HOLleu_33038 [Holothuria leucospilota]|uniref:Uncharacterized protein n=1 Tax=Holothuria leucospilota TaxID=206669 RepID=A0A9Q0YTA7_HOLLE|nr:hypothetical protein HOLleu_33038 [Holothuria leucospilota]
MYSSKRTRIRNSVQLRENMKAEAVRQRSLMLLTDYRTKPAKDDTDDQAVNAAHQHRHDASRAPHLYPSVEQTASKYGRDLKDKILPNVHKHNAQTQITSRSKVVDGTVINTRNNINVTTAGFVRHGKMVDRRKLEEHPAVVCPPSKREKKKIPEDLNKKLLSRDPTSKGPSHPGPSVAIAHVCTGPSESPCLRVTYHSASQNTKDPNPCEKIPFYPTTAEEVDKDYLKLESTERKIKDFLRRTSAVAASRSKNGIMEAEASHENDLLSGFVGPEERKRQFSKVYHLEPPRALSGLTGTTNSPVDSYSSPIHDRSDSPLVLPPLTLPPIRQRSTQRQQSMLQIGAPEKARKPLTGREWRQLKKCRYLRLGPNRQDPNMRELSVQEVFPSNTSK